jgi:hypothetical protein
LLSSRVCSLFTISKSDPQRAQLSDFTAARCAAGRKRNVDGGVPPIEA